MEEPMRSNLTQPSSRPATRRWWRMLGLIGVLAMTGCASIYERNHAYLGSPRYPSTMPASVQILASEPDRPKVQLGEIVLTVEGSPRRDTLENRLKKAAAKLGADAVFVVYDKTHLFPVAYWDWWGPWSEGTYSDRVIVAVAIKFT
jgi:hypothetical protein